MNLQTIAENLAAVLETISGVRAYTYRRSQFATSGDADVAIMVVPDSPFIDYYEAMVGGQGIVRWTLQVRIPAVAEDAAHRRLYALLSAGAGETVSIIDTVKPNDLQQTLSGVIDDLKLGAVTVGVAEEQNGAVYIGADIGVEMLVPRRH